MTASIDLAAALRALPVFPLPDVVLFPGARLPLHVFEPRYRSMLADALASHRCLAMGLIVQPETDPPRIAKVAGLGAIVQHETLPDGRSNIVLEGRARVTLDELPPAGPYRKARARVLDEIETRVTDGELTMLHGAITRFLTAVKRRSLPGSFTLPPGIDASGAADLCAHHLLLEASTRQRALEELDVAARVRLVATELMAQTLRLPGSDRGNAN